MVSSASSRPLPLLLLTRGRAVLVPLLVLLCVVTKCTLAIAPELRSGASSATTRDPLAEAAADAVVTRPSSSRAVAEVMPASAEPVILPRTIFVDDDVADADAIAEEVGEGGAICGASDGEDDGEKGDLAAREAEAESNVVPDAVAVVLVDGKGSGLWDGSRLG